jgi:methionyl-tRNA synthetase
MTTSLSVYSDLPFLRRFHCIYWPAFLIALGLPLPRHILTHAHWTIGHEKMSKSIGNVVNPFNAMDMYGVDVIRYYLALEGGIGHDSDYNNYRIVARHKELSGTLGNLVSRLFRSKKWVPAHCIAEVQARGMLVKPPVNHLLFGFWTELNEMPSQVALSFERLDVSGALKDIMGIAHSVSPQLRGRRNDLFPLTI